MDGLVRIDWPFVRQFFKIKNRLKHTDTETALNFKLLLGEYMKLSVPATVSFLGSSGSLKSVKIHQLFEVNILLHVRTRFNQVVREVFLVNRAAK